MKYINKEIFSILLNESRVHLNKNRVATTVPISENSNLLIDEDIEILQLMCIPIREIDFITANEKRKPKMNQIIC